MNNSVFKCLHIVRSVNPWLRAEVIVTSFLSSGSRAGLSRDRQTPAWPVVDPEQSRRELACGEPSRGELAWGEPAEPSNRRI